ncbi:MAG TPA: prephenate dehydrogenase/arogenate dehydrogenase family protein [Herbaspirillum sp.]
MAVVFKKIAVFGVGLIGGSFALALKKAGAVEQLIGVGRSPEAIQRAHALGIIDNNGIVSAADAVRDADLVLIAAPVAQTGAILRSIAPHLQPHTVVTDAGSTKSDVVQAARDALGQKIGQFVPGHPIAGGEQNGPDAALADLYAGKKTVLTALPENTDAQVARVSQAWQLCGARIYRLTPQEHDGVFAAVSHLPHLLAFALVDQLARRPEADLLFQYAASGFRDFTRIAGSSPEMWRDIALANQVALLDGLDGYIAQLQQMRQSLADGDGAQLLAVFANARKARHDWIHAIEKPDGEK